MANELAKASVAGNQLPAFLQDRVRKDSIGNIDSTDLIIPRVKLLQAISPEVTEYDNAKAGSFWHTLRQENLGTVVMGIPIITRKSYVLWAPRGDERGILARSVDAVHWDPPNAEFTVKPKGSATPVTWRTARTVAESGLDRFGSSIPENANSQPAAALTYETLWYLPEHETRVLILNTRSAIKPAKNLFSAIQDRPVDGYLQVYNITTSLEKGAEGPYFNYKYLGAGYVQDENLAKMTEALYNEMKEAKFRASDEEEDGTDAPPFQADTKASSQAGKSNKERKF